MYLKYIIKCVEQAGQVKKSTLLDEYGWNHGMAYIEMLNSENV